MTEVYRHVLGRQDVVPGMIAGIQTFGELVHFHPHLHVIVSDGAFGPDGTFVCLPKGSTELLLKSWQTRVFKFLVAAEKIDQSTEDQMRSWPHSGFSVDDSICLAPGDTFGLERLAQSRISQMTPLTLARDLRPTLERQGFARSTCQCDRGPNG